MSVYKVPRTISFTEVRNGNPLFDILKVEYGLCQLDNYIMMCYDMIFSKEDYASGFDFFVWEACQLVYWDNMHEGKRVATDEVVSLSWDYLNR